MAAPQSLSKDFRDKMKDVKEMMALLKSRGQEMKRKKNLRKQILTEEIAKLQDVSDSSSLDDQGTAEEIMNQQQELVALDKDIEETTKKISQLQQKVKVAESDFQEHLKTMENKLLPRARYAVNLFREVSKVSWQTRSPNEVKGFIRTKSGVKTFCFDEQKQSQFFITNSLWEMGEEEIW